MPVVAPECVPVSRAQHHRATTNHRHHHQSPPPPPLRPPLPPPLPRYYHYHQANQIPNTPPSSPSSLPTIDRTTNNYLIVHRSPCAHASCDIILYELLQVCVKRETGAGEHVVRTTRLKESAEESWEQPPPSLSSPHPPSPITASAHNDAALTR